MIVPPDVRDEAIRGDAPEKPFRPGRDPVSPGQLLMWLAISLLFCLLPYFWPAVQSWLPKG